MRTAQRQRGRRSGRLAGHLRRSVLDKPAPPALLPYEWVYDCERGRWAREWDRELVIVGVVVLFVIAVALAVIAADVLVAFRVLAGMARP